MAVATAAEGCTVELDRRPMRTPAKQPLLVPTPALAEAIAEEWRAQGETVEVAAMPLTRLACTAVDRASDQREAIIDELVRYGGTDLLCYRADHPAELVAWQAQAWQPLLDWALLRYDARLKVVSGVVPVAQPDEALRALRAAVAALDAHRLTGLHAATAASGSLVVALALAEGEIDARRAFDVSQLDETFAIERWGEDEELSRRRAAMSRDLEAAACFLALCGSCWSGHVQLPL